MNNNPNENSKTGNQENRDTQNNQTNKDREEQTSRTNTGNNPDSRNANNPDERTTNLAGNDQNTGLQDEKRSGNMNQDEREQQDRDLELGNEGRGNQPNQQNQMKNENNPNEFDPEISPKRKPLVDPTAPEKGNEEWDDDETRRGSNDRE